MLQILTKEWSLQMSFRIIIPFQAVQFEMFHCKYMDYALSGIHVKRDLNKYFIFLLILQHISQFKIVPSIKEKKYSFLY